MGDVDVGSNRLPPNSSSPPSSRRPRRVVEISATISTSASNKPTNDGDVTEYHSDAEEYYRMISDVTDQIDQFHPSRDNVGTSSQGPHFTSYRNTFLLSLHKMKTKNFFLLIGCFTLSSLLFWLLSNPAPNFQTFVKETHKQINNLNSKIQKNLATDPDSEFEVDSAYLELLGFVRTPRLYKPGTIDLPISNPSQVDRNTNGVDDRKKFQRQNISSDGMVSNKTYLPVVVTAVTSANVYQAMNFIKSMQRHLPEKTLVLYDLGLSSRDVLTLKKACNCSIRVFEFDKYPAHVSTLKLKAYRPIIIQEMLNEFTAVLWSDLNKQFLTGNISHLVSRAEKDGILAWRLDLPISALTHPKMFSFFQTKRDQFYFVHMVDTNQLMIFNHRTIHEQVMLPWVKCALTEECIAPPGAQLIGCNFDRKPYFRYSGCHRYDSSALNIILGLHFELNDKRYSCDDVVFGTETLEEEMTSSSNGNSRLNVSTTYQTA